MFHFLTISNLNISKGIFTLLDACVLLKNKGFSYHLHMIGAETAEISAGRFFQEFSRRELQNHVTYHGRQYNQDKEISMVCGRQYEGFYKASKYLLEKGYRKIAYCTGTRAVTLQDKGINIDSDRYRGYMDALAQSGIAANTAWLFSGVREMEDGRKIMRKILELSEKPDAVIAGSDEVAAGMVMEALKNGVKIPQDIAIMGVDDQPLASYLQIPLTTIWQPVQDEGRCAAKEMVRQLKGESEGIRRKELDLKLIVRQSA